VTYVIAEPCVDILDKACIEECPVDCIYEADRMLLHPPRRMRRLRSLVNRSAGRGDLLRGRSARQVAHYTQANVDFFDDSARRAGRQGRQGRKDPSLIANLPRKKPSISGT